MGPRVLDFGHVHRSVPIKILVLVLAAFLLIGATVQEVHVHRAASPDCALCVTAHSPAAAPATIPMPVPIATNMPEESTAPILLATGSVAERFIRPPPAVL